MYSIHLKQTSISAYPGSVKENLTKENLHRILCIISSSGSYLWRGLECFLQGKMACKTSLSVSSYWMWTHSKQDGNSIPVDSSDC